MKSYAVVVEFVTHDGDDRWLRDKIAGRVPQPVPVHRVIVEAGEAQQLIDRLANLKHERRKPYGGANYTRWYGVWNSWQNV